MKNPIGFGLAILATASLAAAHGEGDGKDGKDSPLLDNLFQQGTKVSYKPGGGVTFDGGEEFRMNIRGRIQIFWQYADFDNVANPAGDTPGDLNTFGLRRARTNFRGHVFSEDVTYYLQNSHEGGTSIKDATIGWRFMNSEDYSINLRLGLHKLRSGLQQDGSSSRLEFPERSAASRP